MKKLLKEKKLEQLETIDLYPVISSEFCAGRPPLEILRELAKGGAKIVQMREKNKSKRELHELAISFREITNEYGMLFIVNDHLDIALSVNADGVHLGQDDFPLKAARELAPNMILGVSSHSMEEAMTAQEDGADYVNIGPVYPTKTKKLACEFLGLDAIKEISPSLHIPFTVMGGIKEKHIPELISLGATRIAMVTEITQADNVSEKVKQLRACWK
jgi:thiamine-phosphate pyrophosphorylase